MLLTGLRGGCMILLRFLLRCALTLFEFRLEAGKDPLQPLYYHLIRAYFEVNRELARLLPQALRKGD